MLANGITDLWQEYIADAYHGSHACWMELLQTYKATMIGMNSKHSYLYNRTFVTRMHAHAAQHDRARGSHHLAPSYQILHTRGRFRLAAVTCTERSQPGWRDGCLSQPWASACCGC